MNREAAVRAAAEAIRRYVFSDDAAYVARIAVDAAAPHLTDQWEPLYRQAMRERDEACRDAQEWMRRAEKAEAEVERLRGSAAVIDGDRNLWRARAERAEAEVERMRRGWDADVDWANRLLGERDEALGTIARVEALHPNNGGWCNRCRTQHPCATVAALRGDQP